MSRERYLQARLRQRQYDLHLAEKANDPAAIRKYKKLVKAAESAIEREKHKVPSPAELERAAKKAAKQEKRERARLAKALERQRLKAQAARQAPGVPRKARKPLAKGKGLPAVNQTRAAAAREQYFSVEDGYYDYIVKQPCVRCRKPGPSDPAHMVKRSRGRERSGPETMLPLCRLCHSWQEVNDEQFAEEFEQREGITPLEMARALRAAYLLAKDKP